MFSATTTGLDESRMAFTASSAMVAISVVISLKAESCSSRSPLRSALTISLVFILVSDNLERPLHCRPARYCKYSRPLENWADPIYESGFLRELNREGLFSTENADSV